MSSEVGRLLGASWDLDSTLIGAAGDGRSRSSLVGDSDEHLQLGRSGHHNSAQDRAVVPLWSRCCGGIQRLARGWLTRPWAQWARAGPRADSESWEESDEIALAGSAYRSSSVVPSFIRKQEARPTWSSFKNSKGDEARRFALALALAPAATRGHTHAPPGEAEKMENVLYYRAETPLPTSSLPKVMPSKRFSRADSPAQQKLLSLAFPGPFHIGTYCGGSSRLEVSSMPSFTLPPMAAPQSKAVKGHLARLCVAKTHTRPTASRSFLIGGCRQPGQ
ncbi:hypothetical protein Purlil1_6162 [Purpureocillium lilacinum]|uniref:Uncharacterized protein n=1 Tax=Purpureocillium lilacinum TaxID=33203 RepID=A0ABR0BZS4_PURLI|nr:hypothetical protein Purlil1_6162 [Purpureocillium lilacinum]